MLAWILILACCVALLSLILHDATKGDDGGSAIAIAARLLWAFIRRTASKVRNSGNAASDSISQSNVSKPPAHAETATGNSFSSPDPDRQGIPPAIKQASAAPPAKKKSRRKDGRTSIPIAELESAIGEAVRNAAPNCEAFVGVIVEQTMPKSRLDANWAVRGMRFGTANREAVNDALIPIVERMKTEFMLSEEKAARK
jgi:hypothetical protein